MTPTYFVIGPQGFWGRGQFISSVKDAKPFTYEEAIAFCKRRFGSVPGLQCYPVREDDVLEVARK